MTKVLIIGGGAWGTALALAAIEANCSVTIIVRTKTQADEINNLHTNSNYLPNINLPLNLAAATFNHIEEYVNPQILILAVPSNVIHDALHQLTKVLIREYHLVIASKGLDEVNSNLFGKTIADNFDIIPAFISGPNFAKELAQKLPAASIIAHPDLSIATKISNLLQTSYFNLKPIDDVITLQLAGSYKNALAIYCGYIIGKNLGENYRAQICTEALKELEFISEKLGGNPLNIYSYAGIGDIILSCFSEQSRNFRFGKYLANLELGEDLPAAPYLTEGVKATLMLHQLCMPFIHNLKILSEIYKLIKAFQYE